MEKTNIQELLILLYLNEYEDMYLLGELKKITNYSTVQLKKVLEELNNKKLINYNQNDLYISEDGKSILKQKELFNINFNELFSDKISLEIENKLSFEDIYIPEKFKL